MGHYEHAKEIRVHLHEEPKRVVLKDSNGNEVVREYLYGVEILFNGSSIKANCLDIEDANRYCNEHRRKYVPSYEEVTGNGKWSCD